MNIPFESKDVAKLQNCQWDSTHKNGISHWTESKLLHILNVIPNATVPKYTTANDSNLRFQCLDQDEVVELYQAIPKPHFELGCCEFCNKKLVPMGHQRKKDKSHFYD